MTPAQTARLADRIESAHDRNDKRARLHVRHNAHGLRIKRAKAVTK